MRVPSLLHIATSVILVRFAVANFTLPIAELPSCSVPCLISAISNSPCSPNDDVCICSSTSLQAQAEDCVRKACRTPEALFVKNATMTACHVPVRDRGQPYNVMNITLSVITAIVFLLRLYFKLGIAKSEFWLDDWFIIVAFFTAVPSVIVNTRGLVAHGMGRDVWTLDIDTILSFAMFFYIMEIMYFLHVPMLKASFLFFYLRIFPHSRIRNILWGTLAVNAVAGVIFLFVVIFQCTPIEFFWTKWDDAHDGRCLNVNAVGWSNAALSVLMDIWILALPLSQVTKLHLHWKKKAGVILMFAVGTFVTIVSIIRLQFLVHFSNSSNPTWDQWEVAHWSTIEINVGIMCACMPAIRGILVRLFPRLFGGTTTNDVSASGMQYHAPPTIGSSRLMRLDEHETLGRSDGASRFEMGGMNHNHDDAPKPDHTKSTTGIFQSKTFSVEYGWDHDEAKLVPPQPPPGVKSRYDSDTSS